MKIAIVVVSSLLVFLLIVGIPFAWIIRDGLGPNSVESTGTQAVLKTFWTFHIGPLVALLSVIRLSLFCATKKHAEEPLLA